jgi:hypothetical protein
MPHPGTRRADFDGATPITLSPLKEAHAGQGHQAGPIYLSRDKKATKSTISSWTVVEDVDGRLAYFRQISA